jgi:hypothetical protein
MAKGFLLLFLQKRTTSLLAYGGKSSAAMSVDCTSERSPEL